MFRLPESFDNWRLASPPRFEDTPMTDPDRDEDGDPIDEPTPLLENDGDHVGGGPVGQATDVIPVSDILRYIPGEVEGAD